MGDIRIVPITDLRRNFGALTADLPYISEIILTKDGRPFATLRAAADEKRRLMMESAGSLKGMVLDNDKIWIEVLKRKSRKTAVNL
jgi:antitoxin (DNA-binding transcriptional repressor) of toxin-antitoxin stability system